MRATYLDPHASIAVSTSLPADSCFMNSATRITAAADDYHSSAVCLSVALADDERLATDE